MKPTIGTNQNAEYPVGARCSDVLRIDVWWADIINVHTIDILQFVTYVCTQFQIYVVVLCCIQYRRILYTVYDFLHISYIPHIFLIFSSYIPHIFLIHPCTLRQALHRPLSHSSAGAMDLPIESLDLLYSVEQRGIHGILSAKQLPQLSVIVLCRKTSLKGFVLAAKFWHLGMSFLDSEVLSSCSLWVGLKRTNDETPCVATRVHVLICGVLFLQNWMFV